METEVAATAVGITVIAAVVVLAKGTPVVVMEIVPIVLRTTDIDTVDGIMVMATNMDVSAAVMVARRENVIKINMSD